MTNEKMMKEAPIWKLILKMSLPMLVIMLMNVVYNMADTFFIGQTGSVTLVAAVSLASPVFGVLSGLNVLIGSGACTAIAIALGQKDGEKVKQYSAFCFWSALALGIAAGAAILLGMDPLVRLLGATAETASHTAAYLRILALGAPISVVGGVLGNAIRGDGSSLEPMVLGIAGNVVNIALDPLFILAFGWGVTGAALATVLGNTVTFLGLLWLLRKRKAFSLSPRHFTLKPTVSLKVLSLGLPMALGVILQSCSGVFSNQLLMRYGTEALAASKVSGMSGMLLGMMLMGITMGVQPAISYLHGAGDRRRMRSLLRTTGIFTVLLGTAAAAGCFLARDAFVAAFLDNAAVLELGRFMILGSLVTIPVTAVYQLCSAYLQGTGKVSFATVVSLLRQGLVLVPMLYLMEALLGLPGLVFAGAAADLLSTVIAGALSLRWAKTQPDLEPAEEEEVPLAA